MSRAPRRGMPAAAVLVGGVSRHGASCGCPYCAAPDSAPPAPAATLTEVAAVGHAAALQLEVDRLRALVDQQRHDAARAAADHAATVARMQTAADAKLRAARLDLYRTQVAAQEMRLEIARGRAVTDAGFAWRIAATPEQHADAVGQLADALDRYWDCTPMPSDGDTSPAATAIEMREYAASFVAPLTAIDVLERGVP